MAKSVDVLIQELDSNLNLFIEEQSGFYAFRNKINQDETQYSITKKFIDRSIDLEWVSKIEDCIISLDNILRNPRNFIEEREEIIPIEMSRKIGPESVKHLATHTNMIQSVDTKRNTVTPQKILNVYKEESFATYENKFIKTLLIHLQLFIDRRYLGLKKQRDVRNISAGRTEQHFNMGSEEIKYTMEINVKSASENKKTNASEGLASSLSRIEKLKYIVDAFMTSRFMELLKDAPLVRPPIAKTNLLTKNVDYKACLDLWGFVESYSAQGYEVNLNDTTSVPDIEYQRRMNEIAYIEYLYLKKYTDDDVEESLRRELYSQLDLFSRLSRNTDDKEEEKGGLGSAGRLLNKGTGEASKESGEGKDAQDSTLLMGLDRTIPGGVGDYSGQYDDLEKSGEAEDSESSLNGDGPIDSSLRPGVVRVPEASEGSEKEQLGSYYNIIAEENRGAVRKEFRQLLGHYSDNLEEVRNIFLQEYEKHNRALEKEEKQIYKAIQRIIKRQAQLEEKERREEQKRIERQKREEERRQQKLQREFEREKAKEERRLALEAQLKSRDPRERAIEEAIKRNKARENHYSMEEKRNMPFEEMPRMLIVDTIFNDPEDRFERNDVVDIRDNTPEEKEYNPNELSMLMDETEALQNESNEFSIPSVDEEESFDEKEYIPSDILPEDDIDTD